MPEKANPLTCPRAAAGTRPTTVEAMSTISTPPESPDTSRQNPNHA